MTSECPKVAGAVYLGTCPRCRKQWTAQLLVFKQDGEVPLPPPSVRLICQCEIPVQEIKLVYQTGLAN